MKRTLLRCGSLILAGAAISSAATAAGIITADPTLPPHGVYRTAADVHATYLTPLGLLDLRGIEHIPLGVLSRTPSGPDEIETFDSHASGMASIPSFFDVFVELDGPTTTRVMGYPGAPATGLFDTEMLAMDLLGVAPVGPIAIRESPTLPSLGRTSIQDLGGGLYHIDSFFDVFTELSLDGGTTWIPAQSSVRVTLTVPEGGTTTGLLLAAAVVLQAGAVRRWRYVAAGS